MLIAMDWYYQENGQQFGPLTEVEFQDRVRTGIVQSNTLVWNETLKGWLEYRTVARKDPNSAISSLTACSECGKEFPEGELLRYQNSWICAQCKPLFFQRIKETGEVAGTLAYAGFWTRFGARLIDSLILTLGFSILLALAVFLTISSSPEGQSALGIFVTFMAYPVFYGGFVLYEALFTMRYGATPGKMALGLKIVTATGERLSTARSFARGAAVLLSWLICFIGFIFAAFDSEQHKALHDIICSTRVIRI